MIKNFKEYINEDYFSKLASRKDTGNVRKENEITEDFVRRFITGPCQQYIHSITIRKENGKTVVDVDGDFYLIQDIEEIPFQFGTITGDFNCYKCDLTSLKGCPKEVGGDFECHNCRYLKSLEGCPEKVNGAFYCWNCAKNFTDDEVKSICKVGKEIMC